MAQLTETLEPYVKVIETVKQPTLNPTAGENLIIGVVLISDAGPSTPTLVTGQSDFLKYYSSRTDVTEDYIKSLNKLYTGSNKETAATMWSNAYRLSGSNNLLVCRASKADDIFYTKPLNKDSLDTYILRSGELMKKVPSFKFVLDIDADDSNHDQDGWSININGVGIFGNRTTDKGPQYDYYVNSLSELVEKLNETNKFFSPSYTFYSDDRGTIPVDENSEDVISVIFNEVYLGVDMIDTSDSRCPEGKQFIISCEPDWEFREEDPQDTIDLNDSAWSGFEPSEYYATNVYNSSTELKVRIRRFNHDAVISKEITNDSLTQSSESPYSVLKTVLDTFTKNGKEEPSQSILERDFYEICVTDPSLSNSPLYFNVGTITGRGDMTVSEVNESLSMIQLTLPDNLRDLNLNYYGYTSDDNIWVEINDGEPGTESPKKTVDSYDALLKETDMQVGDIYKVGTGSFKYYKYSENGQDQIFVDLRIDPENCSILNISDSDLKRALDLISQDEIYITEGLCDLGNTEISFQNYMANMAINENYFYPISTLQSTNYLSIANYSNKLSQDSYKLYMSAPWDIDTGTLGWKYNVSPAVIYWEAVARNKRNNSEFAPVLGQTTGIVQYQKPMIEFNKKTRQLLLSKKINTVLWNYQTNAWNMNDNYTKQSLNNVMSDDGNSRLAIRISKSIPTLLKQYIGWKINSRLWEAASGTLDYWFKTVILPMQYTVDSYRITIDESNNPIEIQRQNKMVVKIEVRYAYSLKYIEVYHDILDIGMEFSTGEE